MNNYKEILLTGVCALMTMNVSAQYDPYYSHYFDMQPAFNPAAAGKEAQLNVTATYAMALTGFEHAPQTAFISGDMPFTALNQIHGVGLQLMSDKIGLFTHQRLSAQYALRKKLGEKSWLSVGVQGGLLNETFRGSDADLIDENDPVFTKSETNGNAFDLGFGLYFRRANWYVGLSGQHLTYPTIELGETNEITVTGTYHLNGGAVFDLPNPLLKFAPSAIIRTDGVAYRADVTGRVIYTFDDKMFYGGVTYSPTNSVTALIGGRFQGIVLGYSFEVFTNGLGFRNGSHELFVGYQTDVDLGKKGRNRHQTTRTL